MNMENQENTNDIVEEKTITLRKPLAIGTGEKAVTFETVDLREPTAGELDQASRSPSQVGMVISLISLVAKVPRKAVESMSQRDLKECSDFLASFADNGLTTGETPSPN
jgi:hypothetical protein